MRVGVVVGIGMGVAPEVVEPAPVATVGLSRVAALGGFVSVVDLGPLGHLVAARMEAGAVAHLDAAPQGASEEPALPSDVGSM